MDEIKQAILEDIRDCILWVSSLKGQVGPRRIPDYWLFGIVYRPSAIAGRALAAGERKLWSRAVESLETDGEIRRVSSGNGSKTTHVRPEPSLIRSWLVEADDSTGRQIIAGLNRTNGWGQRILGEVVG